jgi:hypothetical protein
MLSADVAPPLAGADLGARRGVVRRGGVRLGAARFVVRFVARFVARRAILRPPFFREVFLLLLALRDLALLFAFVPRFFAIRAPSNECARILAPVVTRMPRT